MIKIKFYTKAFWIALIICLIFAAGNVWERNKSEQAESRVSLTVDSKNLYQSFDEDFDLEDTFKKLKKAGVDSIGLNESSLQELEARKLLNVTDGNYLVNSLWKESLKFTPTKDRTYISVAENDLSKEIKKVLKESKLGDVKVVQSSDGESVLEINAPYNKIYSSPIGHLPSDIALVTEYFDITYRVSNKWEDREDVLEAYITDLKNQTGVVNVVFSGTEAQSYKDLNEFWLDYKIGMIEVFNPSQKQLGVKEYALASDYNAFRVHSLSNEVLAKYTKDEIRRLAVKAVNERNIRMLYINLPVSLELAGEEKVFSNVESISTALTKAGHELTSDISVMDKPDTNNISKWMAIVAIVLISLLTLSTLTKEFIVLSEAKKNVLFLGLALVGSAGAIILSNNSLVIAALSLLATIVSPIYISVLAYQNKENMNKKTILKMVVVYITALVSMLALNSNLSKMLYLEGFRGVSLTLSIPILISLIYLVIKNIKHLSLKKVLFKNIRIIDVLVVGVLGAVMMFYLSRSGNFGTMLPFEEVLRNGLEDLLQVRPRTKEFLLAIPLSVVMFFYWNKFKPARYLLPVFTMFIASTNNTFTHFHTPLEFSLLRTVYGMIIGLIIGLIIVLVIEAVRKEFKLIRN